VNTVFKREIRRSRTETDLMRSARLYGEFLRAQGRQTDKRKTIFHLLNELALIDAVPLDSPLMAGLDLISECNLACEHCFRDSSVLPFGSAIGTAELLRIIEELDALGVIEVYLTGGEPFLRSDLLEILKKIKSYNMMTNIHSNGTVLKVSVIDQLADLLEPNMDFIQISLDGANAETHNFIRGAKCFDKIVRTIEYMTRRQVPTRINMVVHRDNFSEMADMYSLAAALNVSEVSFSPLLRTSFNHKLSLPSDREILLEFARVVERHRGLGEPIRIIQDPIAVPCGNSLLGHEMKWHFQRPRYVCPAGSSALEIDPKGEVYPCPYLHYSVFSAGNVRQRSVCEIWQSAEVWSSLRGGKELRGHACTTCDFRNGCGGACAAQAFHEAGTLDHPDTRCERAASQVAAPASD
jgi:radical SAM protein with 4Fe4S-binding SPASM domain